MAGNFAGAESCKADLHYMGRRGLGYAVVGEVQEERFVAGRQAEDAGVWEPALNVCLSKSLGKPYAHLF